MYSKKDAANSNFVSIANLFKQEIRFSRDRGIIIDFKVCLLAIIFFSTPLRLYYVVGRSFHVTP